MTLKRLSSDAIPSWSARVVVNITDVNDKIYACARELGGARRAGARVHGEAYLDDTDRLGLGRPDIEPLATETVPRSSP